MIKLPKRVMIIPFVFGIEILGGLGSFVTTPTLGNWYKDLIKPAFMPPDWVFAPAWTLLFALMGISVYLVYEKGLKSEKVRVALIFFIVQFIFNTSWTLIFFGARLPVLALIDIVILWFLILLTILKFYKVSKTAGLILLPYLLWVSFATYLNWSVVVLNNF